MKPFIAIFYFAIVLGIFFSCDNSRTPISGNETPAMLAALSHDERVQQLRIDSLQATFEAPLPVVVTSRVTITEPADLIGNWVGMFEPHESLWDQTEDFGESEYSSFDLTNKINVSIDSLNDQKVFGHSVVAGNSRPFIGTYTFGNNSYSFDVREPGDDKEDGVFSFSIANNDTLMKGEWRAYKAIKLPRRQYELKKKLFVYDPDISLSEFTRFEDFDKIKTRIEEEEGETYESEVVYASTEDALKFNASNTLLKKEDVENLKKADLFIIRNSIFARHGYSFRQKAVRQYFDFQDWYIPVQADVRHELTDLEIKNIELLMRYEEHAEEYYDYFGR